MLNLSWFISGCRPRDFKIRFDEITVNVRPASIFHRTNTIHHKNHDLSFVEDLYLNSRLMEQPSNIHDSGATHAAALDM